MRIVEVKPITHADVVAGRANVCALLRRAADRTDTSVIPQAAEVIRGLLGRIVITDRPRTASTRRDWIARFTPKVKAVLPPGTPCDDVEIPEQELVLDPEPLGIRIARQTTATFSIRRDARCSNGPTFNGRHGVD